MKPTVEATRYVPCQSKPSVSLTGAEKCALLAVRDGADVFGYGLALTLRQIERKVPEYITITKARGNYGDGTGREPYFGAIATAAGILAAEKR